MLDSQITEMAEEFAIETAALLFEETGDDQTPCTYTGDYIIRGNNKLEMQHEELFVRLDHSVPGAGHSQWYNVQTGFGSDSLEATLEGSLDNYFS